MKRSPDISWRCRLGDPLSRLRLPPTFPGASRPLPSRSHPDKALEQGHRDTALGCCVPLSRRPQPSHQSGCGSQAQETAPGRGLQRVHSWAWLLRDTGNFPDRLEPHGAPEPDGAKAASEDRGLSGPRSQKQLLCPVFSKGRLLKAGSPPRRQTFSTRLTVKYRVWCSGQHCPPPESLAPDRGRMGGRGARREPGRAPGTRRSLRGALTRPRRNIFIIKNQMPPKKEKRCTKKQLGKLNPVYPHPFREKARDSPGGRDQDPCATFGPEGLG